MSLHPISFLPYLLSEIDNFVLDKKRVERLIEKNRKEIDNILTKIVDFFW